MQAYSKTRTSSTRVPDGLCMDSLDEDFAVALVSLGLLVGCHEHRAGGGLAARMRAGVPQLAHACITIWVSWCTFRLAFRAREGDNGMPRTGCPWSGTGYCHPNACMHRALCLPSAWRTHVLFNGISTAPILVVLGLSVAAAAALDSVAARVSTLVLRLGRLARVVGLQWKVRRVHEHE